MRVGGDVGIHSHGEAGFPAQVRRTLRQQI